MSVSLTASPTISINGALQAAKESYGAIQSTHDLPDAFHEAGRAIDCLKDAFATYHSLADTSEARYHIMDKESLQDALDKGNRFLAILSEVQEAPDNDRFARYASIVGTRREDVVEKLVSTMIESFLDLSQGREDWFESHVAVLKGLKTKLEKMEPSISPSTGRIARFNSDSHIQQFSATGDSHSTATGKGFTVTEDVNDPLHLGNNGVSKGPSLEERRTSFLRSLAPDTSSDPKHTICLRVEGTCEWCISHPAFREWQSNAAASSNVLWISADPGCGKSVLAKHLVDNVLPLEKDCIISGFFFKDGVANQSTITAALRSIVFEILEKQQEVLTNDFLRHFEIRSEALSQFEELWTILVNIVDRSDTARIVCLLDALDECEEVGRDKFIKTLGALSAMHTRTETKLKFVVTSRPYVGIRREMAGVSLIHLAGESEAEREDIVREIDLVIEARVEELQKILRLALGERDHLLGKLRENPNRTYLWVHLVMEEIKKMVLTNKKTIYEATTTLPLKLEELYEQMLSKSPAPTEAKELLQIVATAARPLTRNELRQALKLRGKEWAGGLEGNEHESRFIQTIRDLSGLFLYVSANKVHLFHRTVKEFLMEPDKGATRNAQNRPRSLDKLAWKDCLSLPQSHRVLAEICIETLLGLMPKSSQSVGSASLILKEYSIDFWAMHVRESPVDSQEEMTESILKICDPTLGLGSALSTCWDDRVDEVPQGLTTLMTVSYFGLETALARLLKSRGLGINDQDVTYNRSALSWAARNGHVPAVQRMLREKRALLLPRFKIDLRDRWGNTSLLYAARDGNLKMAQLLVGAGAKVNSKDKLGYSPLLWAVGIGHREMVELLLREGADANSSQIYHETALHWAAQYGHDNIAHMLLRKGASVHATILTGQTALHLAAESNRVHIARRLLDWGANINAVTTTDRQTALHLATTWGKMDVARLLLREDGIDIEARDHQQMTPIVRCLFGFEWQTLAERKKSSARSAHVLKMLIEEGVGIDYEYRHPETNQTLLHSAAALGDINILDLLLDVEGIDRCIGARDADGHTPLTLAKHLGETDMTERLAAFACNKNIALSSFQS